MFPPLCLAVAIALGFPAQATAPGALAAEEEAAAAVPPWRQWRSVLFRVLPPPSAGDPARTNDIASQAASFVLGTIHFGDPDELNLDLVALRETLRGTRVLVNEVDGGAHWDDAKERYRVLDDPAGLPGLIGPESFDELLRLLPQVHPAWLRRLKPWAALALLEARGETAGEQTLDSRLERWATDLDLRTEHLETLDEQLAALDCVPPEEQALVLRARLREPWLFNEQSARVIGHYRERNLAAWLDEIDAMAGLDERTRAIEDRARRCLIEARNERWLARLDGLLREGGAFVAVGAIHLTGSAGVLERLRQRGFVIVAESM